MAGLVKDKPSVNCFSPWKLIKGINENPIHFRYGKAKKVTSFGCPILNKSGLQKMTTQLNNIPKDTHSTKP